MALPCQYIVSGSCHPLKKILVGTPLLIAMPLCDLGFAQSNTKEAPFHRGQHRKLPKSDEITTKSVAKLRKVDVQSMTTFRKFDQLCKTSGKYFPFLFANFVTCRQLSVSSPVTWGLQSKLFRDRGLARS